MSSKRIAYQIQVMKALANLHRLSVLMAIGKSGVKGMRSSHVAEELKAMMSLPEASKSLGRLTQLGLLQNELKRSSGGRDIESWYRITKFGKVCLKFVAQL